jgi:hypothetical protein
MTSYTARVELHGADEGEYEALHDAMEAEGFVRWIENQSGVKLRLPTAEYNLPGSTLDRKQVVRRAERAAESVKPNPTPWILVTESAGRTWSGLKPWRE